MGSQTRVGVEADDLLCSRNARPRKALVGRVQWKIHQPPSLRKERASLEGTCISFDARRKEARTKGRGIQLHVFVIRLLCRAERLRGLLLASEAVRVHGCADLGRRVGA